MQSVVSPGESIVGLTQCFVPFLLQETVTLSINISYSRLPSLVCSFLRLKLRSEFNMRTIIHLMQILLFSNKTVRAKLRSKQWIYFIPHYKYLGHSFTSSLILNSQLSSGQQFRHRCVISQLIFENCTKSCSSFFVCLYLGIFRNLSLCLHYIPYIIYPVIYLQQKWRSRLVERFCHKKNIYYKLKEANVLPCLIWFSMSGSYIREEIL